MAIAEGPNKPRSFSFKGPSEDQRRDALAAIYRQKLKNIEEQEKPTTTNEEIEKNDQEMNFDQAKKILEDSEKVIDNKINTIKNKITRIHSEKFKSTLTPNSFDYVFHDVKPQLSNSGFNETDIDRIKEIIPQYELKNAQTYQQYIELITNKLKPVAMEMAIKNSELLKNAQKTIAMHNIEKMLDRAKAYDAKTRETIMRIVSMKLDGQIAQGTNVAAPGYSEKLFNKTSQVLFGLKQKDFISLRHGEVVQEKKLTPEEIEDIIRVEKDRAYNIKLAEFTKLLDELPGGDEEKKANEIRNFIKNEFRDFANYPHFKERILNDVTYIMEQRDNNKK